MSANIQAGPDRTRDSRAIQNREYVRELLAERQPGLAALLQAVERQMGQERPHDPCDRRHTMNTAWLYHPDGSECVDGWSCQAQDHTSIPPRCGTGADSRPIGCELPKGHPGPHLRFADGECCGAGDDQPTALAC